MTTQVDLELLGMTQEELQDRVIDKLVRDLLVEKYVDEDGNDSENDSEFLVSLKELVKKAIGKKVAEIAEAHILPKVGNYIENLTLQKTTQWGEKKGKPFTFNEYLIDAAENYMKEPVSHNGKTKAEDSYNWRANTTRIVYLIERHLQYSISTAMDQAMKDANSHIVAGIEKAIRMALKEVNVKLGATVK